MVRFLQALILLVSLKVHAQIDSGVYSGANISAFAGHLYNRGYFTEAATEYKRLFRISLSDHSSAMLIRSLRAASEYNAAFHEGQLLWDSVKRMGEGTLQEFIAASAWSEHYDSAALSVIQHRLSARDSLKHLINLSILKKDLKKSRSLIESARTQGFDFQKQEEFLEAGEDIRYKKPWIAAGLSAVIPGSGKIYTGEWKDGLFSMLSIGLLAVQSYAGFKRDGWDSPLGLISGGIGLAFYSGGIYGSAKSARRYNAMADSKFKNEALSAFYPAP